MKKFPRIADEITKCFFRRVEKWKAGIPSIEVFGQRIDFPPSRGSGHQGTTLKRVGFLIFLSVFIICLHAMAMSESTDNTTDKNSEYGFSPDRSRWDNYAIDYNYTIYYYDTKSVVKKYNNVKVWIKFGEPIKNNKGPRLYKEATALKEINCDTRLIRSIEWNYLSLNNEYNKYPSPTKWENIEPETADDALFEEVCSQSGKIKKR